MASPPFTLVLRDGESIIENHLVTSENQRLFVVTDSCAGLASRGVLDPIGAGFFNPPLGWWVVEIRRADGSEDQIWAAPDGSVAIRHGECLGVATGAGEGVGTKLRALPLTTSQPAPAPGVPAPPSTTPAGVPTWLLLLGGAGALGYVAYRWMKPKGETTMAKKKTIKRRRRSRRNPDMSKLLLVGAAGVGAYLIYRYFSGTTEAATDAQAKTVMPMSTGLTAKLEGRAVLPVGHVQCIASYLARKQSVASVKVQQLVDGGYVIYGTALPPRSDAGQRVLLKQGTLSEIHDWIYQTWQPDDEALLKGECPAAMASLL